MRFISHIERSLLRQCVTCLAKAAGTMAVLAACHVEAAEEASLEKCDSPKGTLAIAEPQGHIIMALRKFPFEENAATAVKPKIIKPK